MMKKGMLATLLLASLTATAGPAEDRIRANLAAVGETATEVFPAPIKGLYTVVTPQGWLYADGEGKHIIQGQIFDLHSKANLTDAQKVARMPTVDWRRLPLKDAIKVVKGNGKRQLVVFSDPDCPYCKMLEQQSLAHINDVTVYTFLYPIDGLHPDATRKARLIWCAKDRAKAWDDWMQSEVLPAGDGKCATPIERNLALAQKLKVQGTPLLVFKSGAQMPGARPPQVIEQKL
ncbi:DsbC family protein [Paracidovorax citrulli]